MKDFSILVVDNEEEILTSLKQSLEEFGKRFRHKIDVKVARSVLEALKIIRKHRVDAVFLDYHFDAGMNGDELIDLLPEYLNSLYIVLISSREKEELEKIVTKRNIQLDQQKFPFRFLSKSTSNNFNLQLQDIYQNIVGFLDRQPLPSLLAYTARTIDESDNSLSKLSAMKDFLETTMKYLSSILVADAFHRSTRKVLKRQINRRSGYTFGAWLGWLQNLLAQEKIGNINDFVPEIWQALSEPLSNDDTPLKFLNSFKDIRNEQLGHGFVNEEVYYKKLVEEWINPFTEFRERLHFCTRYPLIAVEKMDFDESDPNKFRYRVRTLMGLDLRPATKELTTKSKLKKNNVYLSDSFGKFLSLHPFVSFELCPKCDSCRVFMMDITCDDKLRHIALCNHRRESKPDFKVLQELITPQDK
jgi:CheY-like chemotaxis protein